MARAAIARRHTDIQAERNRAAAEQPQHPMQRPHPQETMRTPAHRLGPREFGDGGLQDRSEHVRRRLPFALDRREPELGLADRALLALVEAGEAGALQEPLNRNVRRAHPRSLLLFGDVRLFLREPVEDRKSTRLNSSHQIISYAVFCLQKKCRLKSTDQAPPDSPGSTCYQPGPKAQPALHPSP